MMSDEIKIENGEDFAAMLEESFKTLNNGEKVTGTVVGISNNDVQVDLGVKHTAYIPLSELSDDPNYDVAANIHVGDEIEAVVVRVNDGEGTVTLSKKRVDQLKGWETVEKAYRAACGLRRFARLDLGELCQPFGHCADDGLSGGRIGRQYDAGNDTGDGNADCLCGSAADRGGSRMARKDSDEQEELR